MPNHRRRGSEFAHSGHNCVGTQVPAWKLWLLEQWPPSNATSRAPTTSRGRSFWTASPASSKVKLETHDPTTSEDRPKRAGGNEALLVVACCVHSTQADKHAPLCRLVSKLGVEMRFAVSSSLSLMFACTCAVAQESPQPVGSGLQLELPESSLTLDNEVLLLQHTNIAPKPLPAVPGAYGQGFDSATGTLLTKKCVKITSLAPKGGTIPSEKGEHAFHEVSSLDEIRSDTKTSASASLLYQGFSGSAGGSVVNGSFYSSFGRYVTAYQEIILDEYQGKGEGANGDPELTPPALSDLKIGKSTFKSSCGDHFVSGYKAGGVFSVVVSIKSNIDATWKQNDIDVSAGFKGIFGANFSQSSGYSKISKASSFDVRDLSAGVIYPAVSLEDLYKSYNGYQDLVKAKPGLVSFVFTPYSALGGAAKGIPDFSDLEGAKLEELARKRDTARKISNDLEVANNAAANGMAKYFVVDVKPEDARVEIDRYLADIAKAVDACRTATEPNDCTKAIDLVPAVPPNHVKKT